MFFDLLHDWEASRNDSEQICENSFVHDFGPKNSEKNHHLEKVRDQTGSKFRSDCRKLKLYDVSRCTRLQNSKEKQIVLVESKKIGKFHGFALEG